MTDANYKRAKKTHSLLKWNALFLAALFIGLLYTLYVLERRNETNRFVKSQSNFTEQSASFLKSWLDAQIVTARSMASQPTVIAACRNPDDPQIQQALRARLETRLENDPAASRVTLLMGVQTNSPYITTHPVTKTQASQKRSATTHPVPTTSAVTQQGAPYFVSRIFKTPGSRKRFFDLTVPVAQNQEILGALTLTLPADFFSDVFLTPYAQTDTGYYIVAQDSPPDHEEPHIAELLQKGIHPGTAFSHASTDDLKQLNEDPNYIFIAKRIPVASSCSETDWYLIYVQQRDTMLRSTLQLLRAIFLLGVLFIVLYAGAAAVMHNIITKRNKQLAQTNNELQQEIQDRKTIESQLLNKEIWLSSIQNNIQTGIMIIDKDTRKIIDANPAACAMSGCDREDMLGQICHNFVCPNAEGHCPILDHHNTIDNAERTLLTCDSQEVPILKTVIEITLENKEYLLESFVDISALKQAERELRRNQALLNEVQDVAKIGGWEWDIQNNTLLWTDEIYWLTEMPPNQKLTLSGAIRLFLPEYRKMLRKTIFDSVRRNRPFDLELPVLTIKGTSKWIRIMGRPEYKNQKPQRLLGVFQDITQQKTTEDRLAMALTAANDGMWDLDCETMETHYSPRWYTMLGYEAYEFPESYDTWIELVHPDDKITTEKILNAYLAGETDSFNSEIRMRNKQGNWQWILARAKKFFKDDQGRAKRLVGTHVDITELKETQAKLEEARIAAEQANHAKSSFLAVMSHEIRTPMNAVIGMTSLLLNTELSGQQRDYVETVRISADSLLNLINDILDFSKIEAGRMDLEEAPFAVRDVIEDALDLLVNTALDKNLELAYIMENSVPNQVVGDKTRLRQILVNLINNAIKFTHTGEIVVRAEAELLTDEFHKISFSVTDTGIGIPEDRIDNLFDAFTQVDASTTRQFGGTGLGLTISKRLSELMGGDMWVQSGDTGSTFFFYIIVKAKPSKVNVYLREKNPTLNGKRLLIVDDHATNREILHQQAETWGMVTTETTNASDTMKLLENQQEFDLAVLDYHMPKIDGEQLAGMIKKKLGTASFPIIMLSSLNDKPAPDLFAAHLSKPVKPSQLYKVMVDVLGEVPLVHTSAAKPHLIDHTTAERLPLRILLAEDNIINQKVAIHILKNMGYTPDCVRNGAEAVEACGEKEYDIILMDVQMPTMDGLTATQKIRETDSRVYIVALTAGALATDQTAALKAGMNMYMSKPIRIERLADALQQAYKYHSEN